MTHKYLLFFTVVFLFSVSVNSKAFAQYSFKTNKISAGQFNEERKLEIEIHRSDTLLYSIKKTLPPYLSVPETEVLTNGNLLCIHSLEGVIEIYNERGRKIFERYFYEFAPYNEQKLLYTVNEVGVAFLISENNVNKIYTLSNLGEIVFEKEIGNGIAEGFSSSGDSRIFAYSLINWNRNKLINYAEILSLNKNESYKLSSGFIEGKFNEKNELFIGMNKKRIFCTDLTKNRDVWNKDVPEAEHIADAQFDGQRVIIVKSDNPVFEENSWQFRNPVIIEKSFDGNEIQIKSIIGNVREMKLQKTNNKITLVTEKGMIAIK